MKNQMNTDKCDVLGLSVLLTFRLLLWRIETSRYFPLSRYSGGGLGWGFRVATFRCQTPLPNPPPEYRERG
jgi:hypothetical protein